MGREFEVRREVELPGTPEQVWEAVSTEAGLASWLFPERVEGAQAWEPPHHLAVRQEGEGGWFNALEYTIEGRAGGATMRYVHSGIFDDEGWDDQYDAVGGHTDFYLHTLAQYLEHFNGRKATYVGQPSSGIEGPEAAGTPDAMDTLREALGLSASVRVGDEVHASLGKAGALDGVVDYATPEFLGVRTAEGLYRFFGRNYYNGVVGLSAHIFVDGIDATAQEAALKAWLDGIYA
jgi:hypothetical protein